MEKKFMKGNEAMAESAIRAGCRFFAGYPITPQNEIPEYMSRRLPEEGGVFVQAESEVAASNMIYGASATGARVMTSSTGVGIALKAEGFAHLAAADLPAVIINVQRGGQGTGSVQPSQQDYFQATKAPTCGGSKFMVFSPATVQEAIDLTYNAFDYADKYKNPVMILADACIGNMMEAIVLPKFKSSLPDKSDWALDGCKDREARNLSSFKSTDQYIVEQYNLSMEKMYETWQEEEVLVEKFMVEDAEIVITAHGSIGRFAQFAVKTLRNQGIKAGLIRPITVLPFPYDSFKKLDKNKVKNILCAEMATPGQMLEDVKIANEGRIPISFLGHSGGVMVTDEEIVEEAKKIVKKAKLALAK